VDTDVPITKCIDDRLGRVGIARHIADMLIGAPADHSIVFGLSGSWGSGKTSVLNMVGELLSETSDPPVVVRFDPWNYPAGSDLVTPFLTSLASEIRKYSLESRMKKRAEEALEAIADYVDALKPVTPRGMSSLVNLVQVRLARKKRKEERKTLAELKEQIGNSLLSLHLRVVIMIDDLDRLSNDTVCSIFQLVAAVADFSRVSYLLAYDRSNILRALRAVQQCDGDEYLEKIIQVPLELPDPAVGALSAMLQEGVERVVSHVQLSRSELKRVGLSVNDATSRVRTVRDVRRILNLFEADWRASVEKVAPGDLLSMSVLRIVYPKILPWIRAQAPGLSGGTGGGYLVSDAERRKKQYLEALGELLGDCGKADDALRLLAAIFPRVANTCGLHAVSVSGAKLKIDRRIACPEILRSYLSGSMEAYAFPREAAMALLHSGSVDELKGILDEESNDVALTLVAVAGETAADMDEDRRSTFARAIIRSGPGESDGAGLFSLPFYGYESCLEKLFSAMGEGAASELFASEIKGLDFPHLSKIAHFVNGQELAYGRLAGKSEKPREQLISLACLKQVERSIVQTLDDAQLSVEYLAIEGSRMLLYLWSCFDQRAYAAHVTEGLLLDPLAYLLYASYQLGLYHSADETGWAISVDFGNDISMERVVDSFDDALRDDAFWTLDQGVKLKLAGLRICAARLLDGAVSYSEASASCEQCEKLLDQWTERYAEGRG